MGHCINALIGKRDTLAPLIDRLGRPVPTAIDFDLVIVPLDERRLDLIAQSRGTPFSGFTYLTPAMADALAIELGGGPALYIETNYFGGNGSQAAACFGHARLLWNEAETSKAVQASSMLSRLRGLFLRPVKSPINRGLEYLGVTATRDRDEFDCIGLARFRSFKSLGFPR